MKTTRIILFAFVGGTSTVGLVVLLMLIQPIISALIPGRSADRPGHLEPPADVLLSTPVLRPAKPEPAPEPEPVSEPEASVEPEPEPEASPEPEPAPEPKPAPKPAPKAASIPPTSPPPPPIPAAPPAPVQ